VLHQVGVSFDLYYDARKHKIKITFVSLATNVWSAVPGFLFVVIDKAVVESSASFHFYGSVFMTLLILCVSGVNPVEKQNTAVIRWNNV
jgi:hypothetical protein